MLWLWSRLCQENISHEERNRILINAILELWIKRQFIYLCYFTLLLLLLFSFLLYPHVHSARQTRRKWKLTVQLKWTRKCKLNPLLEFACLYKFNILVSSSLYCFELSGGLRQVCNKKGPAPTVKIAFSKRR